jgi:hypothetical protein
MLLQEEDPLLMLLEFGSVHPSYVITLRKPDDKLVLGFGPLRTDPILMTASCQSGSLPLAKTRGSIELHPFNNVTGLRGSF